MVYIFVSHAKENAACAEQIRKDLEAKGYSTWRDQPKLFALTQKSQIGENALLGSAAVVLVWSSAAAVSESVTQQMELAQQLKRPVFAVLLDETDPPATAVPAECLKSEGPCTDVIPSLLKLPRFPDANGTDGLLQLYQHMTHKNISVRRAAIEQAAEMLKQKQHPEEVTALLLYLEKKAPEEVIRKQATVVLDAEEKRTVPPDQSRHFFSVPCDGHDARFDKRNVCAASGIIVRGTNAKLDELRLHCEECGAELTWFVDCEGYR